MFVPVKWLREYVNIEDLDINTLSDKLVMSGSKVEAVEHLGEEIQKVVVGKILEMNPHPNADKLLVTKVDVGTEVIQIVTGANNIKVGDYIPIVMAGGELPGGVKIKKGKLRGEESNGMMCSAKELGIADKVIPQYQKEGIFILDQAYPLGEDIKKVLGFEGQVIEFEITPNRPDCLSILGIARETAATFNRQIQYPDVKIKEEYGNIAEYASIEVRNPELCGRYVGRVATDLVIQPSPVWLQQRLMEAGVRPINNIVDITNYVMLEMGQPLHAFDLDQLEDHKIIVRNAAEGEVFKTLDGVQRNLDENMLMIADGKRSVGLAGVMGGENSEVTEQTKRILIESAYFNADNIRATSKKLGLRTEASARFEKGIDPNGCRLAADRVCQLIEFLGAGKIVQGTIDIYPEPVEKKVIEVRPHRINNLLGISLSPEEIQDILKRLGLEVAIESNIMKVTVPTYRADLLKEIDIVEEVARIYGYDEIPNTAPKGNTQGAKTNGQIIEDYSKDILNGLGLNEITTYSFVSPRSFDMIRIAEDSFMRNVVKLINPLGEENSIMRTTLIANMLEVLARNYNRKVESAKAFELGRIFIPYSVPVNRLPVEKKVLTLGMYGKGTDFYTLKGTIEELLVKLGVGKCQYTPEKNHPSFHPGRCANIQYGEHILGVLGEVHPDVTENYDIDERTYVAELDFNILLQITRLDRLYKPLPKYPAITRDMALVLEDRIYVKEIEDIIWNNGGTILESVKLFDVYKGKQIQEGYKSVAYSLTYRAADRTLVDEEVAQIHDRIVRTLEEKLNAQLRK
ncbi:phenylalanine--tRNA ligase subunit beta [Geosporobacter ferrireducens]|uniref:Phenylalanine--tRNA ligase beta subunit n=1 Tax=Geosporobacter ferrireducens TaxID=1424294 RepID=A0A1D8GD14_9FIRM|nr:phenylalanine--tRNA ligase subunit beta [Geosporobacter ferrireducens]AOT68807.1 phenylalanine--tRNA ligase subunit beta [Geosporobacter ferrireducens]